MKEEARQWIEKSQSDLDIATYNLQGDKLDAAIFFSQQASEKALKALLIERSNELLRTHDLKRLAQLVNAPPEIINLCSLVNPGYSISRYPDQNQIYSKKDCEDIFRASEKILRWIKKNLN